MKLALYITNKLHHRKCFVRILFTRCKTLETHSFVTLTRSFLRFCDLWIKLRTAHFLWSNLFICNVSNILTSFIISWKAFWPSTFIVSFCSKWIQQIWKPDTLISYPDSCDCGRTGRSPVYWCSWNVCHRRASMLCIRQRLQEKNRQILKNTNNSKANKKNKRRMRRRKRRRIIVSQIFGFFYCFPLQIVKKACIMCRKVIGLKSLELRIDCRWNWSGIREKPWRRDIRKIRLFAACEKVIGMKSMALRNDCS